MTLKRTILMIGIAAVLVGSLSLVSAQSADTLTIGVIGDDQAAYQAALLAAEEINAGDDDDIRGVVSSSDDRYNLEIAYYEAGTREEAVDALEEAVNDGVVAVLGPSDDSLAEAIADEGTPDVAVIFALPDAPDGSRLLRATASYDDWAKAAADYLADARGYTRIAVVAVDTSTAENAVETFNREAGNDAIVAELTHEVDEDNFREIAASIRDSDAQALFAWTLDTSMLNLLIELDDIGWDGVIVYAGLDVEFISLAGELAEGVIGITGWTPTAYDSESQAFVADYQARWESTPTDTAAVSYDAVYRIAAAIESSNATASSIASQLSGSSDFIGVQGEYSGLEIDTLRLVQTDANAQLVEAARYDDDECENCPNTWWPETAEDDENSSETFNIGVIAANDGVTETLAENIEQAARMAVREVNDAGGILRNGTRYTLNLQVYTATNSEEAQTAFEQAVEDGVGVVLGPDYNSQIMPNLTLAASNEVVQLVSATSPQIALTESEDYVYQVRPTDDTLATAVADYLVNTRELTEFATVANRTDYGLDSIDTFEDIVSASDDGRVILRLEHDVDDLDMAPLAEQIANSEAQAVAVWTAQPAAQALLEALNALDWDGVFVYGYLSADFGADSNVEVVGPVNWWSSAEDWASRDFVNRYIERYGEAPISQSAAYYDAVYLIAAALEDSGEDIQNGLENAETFTGVQGVYNNGNSEDGELTHSVLIIGFSEGQSVELARYDGETCIVGCEA